MAEQTITFALQYFGQRADQHEIEFYDVAQALIGFERSLALTTHLILNGEIITQAPALKGATIYALPAEAGSWKWTARIVVGTLITFGVAPHDSLVGNLVYSAYDYVVSESLGFHVDYDKTLGAQYEQVHRERPEALTIQEPKFDSLVEKCETAIRYMHRPIIESESAESAQVIATIDGVDHPVGHPFTAETYDYLEFTIKSEGSLQFRGRISSYNMNTFRGRVYLDQTQRPIPFFLSESARTGREVNLITTSLQLNATTHGLEGEITFAAVSFTSRTGRMKSLVITSVGPS